MRRIRPSRVLIADAHGELAHAFERLLAPHCKVVGVVDQGSLALLEVSRQAPDVVVVDVGLPKIDGIEIARRLRRARSRAQVICVSTTEDADIAAEALRVGASGFVLKRLAATELLPAVRAVMHGRSYVSPRLAAGGPSLRPRQQDVLQLLSEGHTIREIASTLSITPQSVAFHRNRLMKRFGVLSPDDLVRHAIAQRLVTIENPVRHGSAERRRVNRASGEECVTDTKSP